MDSRRLLAIGAALALHALAFVGLLHMTTPQPVPATPQPITIRLVEAEPPPAPKPIATPVPTVIPKPNPTPIPTPTPKLLPKPAPVPKRAAAKPAAPPSEPPPAVADPVPPAPRPPTPRPAVPEAPAVSTTAVRTAQAVDAPVPANPIVRTAPRTDASWAGNSPPPYPASARRTGVQGDVRLDVHVGADGKVLDVRLRHTSGSPALDRSAMTAVRSWRFEPATIDGNPVAEWYHDWKWVFRLEE
jgi:periplasmic protein TonB